MGHPRQSIGFRCSSAFATAANSARCSSPQKARGALSANWVEKDFLFVVNGWDKDLNTPEAAGAFLEVLAEEDISQE